MKHANIIQKIEKFIKSAAPSKTPMTEADLRNAFSRYFYNDAIELAKQEVIARLKNKKHSIIKISYTFFVGPDGFGGTDIILWPNQEDQFNLYEIFMKIFNKIPVAVSNACLASASSDHCVLTDYMSKNNKIPPSSKIIIPWFSMYLGPTDRKLF